MSSPSAVYIIWSYVCKACTINTHYSGTHLNYACNCMKWNLGIHRCVNYPRIHLQSAKIAPPSPRLSSSSFYDRQTCARVCLGKPDPPLPIACEPFWFHHIISQVCVTLTPPPNGWTVDRVAIRANAETEVSAVMSSHEISDECFHVYFKDL